MRYIYEHEWSALGQFKYIAWLKTDKYTIPTHVVKFIAQSKKNMFIIRYLRAATESIIDSYSFKTRINTVVITIQKVLIK